MNDEERIKRDMVRRQATVDQFKEQMRDNYRNRTLQEKMSGAERLKIMVELRAMGGFHAEIADLARYGAIRLSEEVEEVLDDPMRLL